MEPDMNYIDIETNAWPLTEYQIKQANRQVSFPKPFKSERYKPIVDMPQPTFDAITQRVDEVAPTNKGTHWEQTWSVAALDAATVAANVITKKSSLKEQATNKREQVETGGTTVGGVSVRTDAGSQAKLTGALNFVGRNPNRTIKWKTATGTFASLNKAAIEAISDGVGEFVAKCFDAEAAHYAAIDVLTTPAQVAAYDVSTGWPV